MQVVVCKRLARSARSKLGSYRHANSRRTCRLLGNDVDIAKKLIRQCLTRSQHSASPTPFLR